MAEADASALAHPGAVRAGVHVPGQVGDEVRGVQANRVRAEVPSWIQERLWDEVDVETVGFVAGVLWTALAYSAPRAGAPLSRTLWLQTRDRATGRIGRRAGQRFGLAAHQEVWRPVTTGVWGPLQEQVAEEVHDAHFAAARGR
jgi:hypothetical protein